MGLRPLIAMVCVGAVVGGALYGLERLRTYVYALPEFHPPVKVELAELHKAEWVQREGWEPRILKSVTIPQNTEWDADSLLVNVAEQISRSGWVSKVRRVWQETNGTVRLACDFRRPIAMLQIPNGKYVSVDKDGVRLPETYDRVDPELGWMRIVGVQSAIPQVGRSFADPDSDAVAAIRLAELIFEQEEIAPQISGIDVTNFGGRRNKRENHIRLLTRAGWPIEWGSAIGREVEENTVEEKLRNIALLLKTGASQTRADVSIYPASVRVGWGK